MPGARQPYLSFWGSTAPTTVLGQTTFQNVGLRVQIDTKGRIFGLRYAREKRTFGTVVGQIYDDATRTLQRVVQFKQHASSGTGFDRWEHAYMCKPYPVAANDIVRIAVWFGSWRPYLADSALATADVTVGHFKLLKTATGNNRNGATAIDFGVCPITDTGGDLWGIDVLFLPG